MLVNVISTFCDVLANNGHKLADIVPLKPELYCTRNDNIFEKLPYADGNVPDNEFSDKENKVILLIVLHCEGSVCVNWFSLKTS